MDASEELRDALDQIDILRSLLLHSEESRETHRLALEQARKRERADLQALLRDFAQLQQNASSQTDHGASALELVLQYFERRIRSLSTV